MKKRIFSLLLAIILLSGSIPVSALEALGETMLPTSVADSNTIEQPPQEGPKEEMPSGDSEPSSSSQAGDGSSTSASEDNSSSESASEESSSSTPGRKIRSWKEVLPLLPRPHPAWMRASPPLQTVKRYPQKKRRAPSPSGSRPLPLWRS